MKSIKVTQKFGGFIRDGIHPTKGSATLEVEVVGVENCTELARAVEAIPTLVEALKGVVNALGPQKGLSDDEPGCEEEASRIARKALAAVTGKVYAHSKEG